MNIFLISQCQKKALKETRRLIDQFAERYGDRTWQTAITKQGLDTLHTLLKKTARKNTAVSCHWIRGKNKTELCWIVGNRQQFDEEGRVPTNRTRRVILSHQHENDWQYGSTIQIISTLAALLHDIGKANVGFQEKLKKVSYAGDPYRHEWLSLQLFVLMIAGCQTNEAVLGRLMAFDEYQKGDPGWYKKLSSVNPDRIMPSLNSLPSVARWLGWLIVSHHRMPLSGADERWDSNNKKWGFPEPGTQKKEAFYIEDFQPNTFFEYIRAFAGWVWNPLSEHKKPASFWQLTQVSTTDTAWLKQLRRWGGKALSHPPLMALINQGEVNDRFLLHLSRLSLMLGDYHFSNQKGVVKDPLVLLANTNGAGEPKQGLSEHLIGVARQTTYFARLLPQLAGRLPALVNHRGFLKRTTEKRFLWQNRAMDLMKTQQSSANEAGFFGVNMASTGCGKTLANSRIMYGLADPKKGLRLTIALGLRVLTLQTGRALKNRLGLEKNELATLIGGNAAQKLFYSEKSACDANAKQGSESIEDLLPATDFVDSEDKAMYDGILGPVIDDRKAKKLLFSPLVACTIDHLTQVSECKRGGRYIVPTLRLLTSDLILDEPDDFDHKDLPALARLVFSAGLLGSKVLLSSATLTPDLVAGLFDAYQAGRKCWQRQHNKRDLPIVCGWFDEFEQRSAFVLHQDAFIAQHVKFVQRRIADLQQGIVQRKATILPVANCQKQLPENADLNFLTLASDISKQAYQLHHHHHQCDAKTAKRVSLGLVRFAHTKNIIALARALYQLDDIPAHVQWHVVVYHAKQLLLLRSNLENKLDRLLDRTKPAALFDDVEIRRALDSSSAPDHLFVVIGTPVTEVGRDHDYDWAIVEPSSMRSIIQLAGRVWRHRPEKEAKVPNIAILSSNLKALSAGSKKPYFCRPGFESRDFPLTSYQSEVLISPEERGNITAIPRIAKSTKTLDTLSGLEHKVMADLFNLRLTQCVPKTPKKRKSNVVTSYWQAELGHGYCIHLQLLTPFRQQQGRETDYVCQYNANNVQGLHFTTAEKAWETPDTLSASSENNLLCYQSWDDIISRNRQIEPWLTDNFYCALKRLSKDYADFSWEKLAIQFAVVTLKETDRGWYYHPWFGFYPR